MFPHQITITTCMLAYLLKYTIFFASLSKNFTSIQYHFSFAKASHESFNKILLGFDILKNVNAKYSRANIFIISNLSTYLLFS